MAVQSTTADTSFTYNGTTVSFTSDQQAILNSDVVKINNEVSNLNSLLQIQLQLNQSLQSKQKDLDQANLVLKSDNPFTPGVVHSSHIAAVNAITNEVNSLNTQIDNNNQSISLSKKNLNINPDTDQSETYPTSFVTAYNKDLVAIQDQIKFQIQAQQANQNAANQNTQNQVLISQNNPSLITQANQLKAQSSEQTKKYVLFGFVIVVVIIAGIVIIKKLI